LRPQHSPSGSYSSWRSNSEEIFYVFPGGDELATS
jgi:hypothetical protein